MKKLLFLTIAIVMLTGCDKGDESQNYSGVAITFKRTDISGAKFLTLASSGDPQTGSKNVSETNRLYKIDENGNMTAVVFYIEIDIHGNITTDNSTEDIKVRPEQILDFGKEYMLFDRCKIDYIIGNYQFRYNVCFLVRKSDGAIFELTNDQERCFPRSLQSDFSDFISEMKIAYNSRGELYLTGDSYYPNVSKLKLENEKLLLQQLTTGIDAYKIMLDKNDNLYTQVGNRGSENIFSSKGFMYFPNSGVATIPRPDNTQRGVLLIDNEYYILDRNEIHQGGYEYIYNYKLSKVNPSAPNLNFKEIAEVTTDKHWVWDFENVISIDAEDRVLFLEKSEFRKNSCLVYDKSAQNLSFITLPDGFDKAQYNLQGIAYEFSTQNCTQITRYNIVDMTKHTINCDRSAVPPFIQTKTQQSTVDFFEFGIKNSNGAPIRVQTNLETGKVTVHEDQDDRKITELIRVS